MGRKAKFNTNELKSIIHKFYKDKQYNGKKLTYTALANYARNSLGYSDIKYYHFERNEEISKMIRSFNESLDESEVRYANDSSKFTSLDIKEFVNNNYGNRVNLTFHLQNLQDSLVKIYERNATLELQKKEYDIKVDKLLKKNETLKLKNAELLEKIKELKADNEVLRSVVECKEENMMIEALNSTGLVLVDKNTKGTKRENIKKLTAENGTDLEKVFSQFNNIF